mgnify:CR=1 FL=1
MAEAEEVDPYQVKAIFMPVFGKEYPRMDEGDYRAFADCFVEYEEREDEEGETYTVVVPIQSLNMVYGNLAAELNQEVSLEDKTNVQRIYMLAKYGVSVPGGNGLPPGQAMGDGSFSALMAEATRYIGYPYVWGGSSPDTSFDCSGYICWVYTRSGVHHLSRTTAQGIYDQCAIVSREEARPGDLCFLTGTYASAGAVSHVGFMLEALGCCIVVRLLAMRTLLLLTGTAICMLLEGWQLFRNEAAKNEICADLPGQLWICDIDF